jgi:hypothetical protein
MAKTQYTPKSEPVQQRFWSKVSKRSNGCWEWQAAISAHGYGRFLFEGGNRLAHRVAWELTYRQPPPAHLMLCHTCDNRRCVNPDHLYVGTAADNSRDKMERGRSQPVRGSRVNTAVFTEEDVARLRLGKLTPTEVSNLFPVTQSSAAKMLRGETWAHLPHGRSTAKTGKSGHPSVYPHGNKWIYRPLISGKRRSCGTFATLAEAIAAAKGARH